MKLTKLQSIALTVATITAGGAGVTGTVWALDARYWTVAEQLKYEYRQVKRELRKAELECEETGSVRACTYADYLRDDLEMLEHE